MQIPIGRNQWKSSWIVGIMKGKINTVSTSTSNIFSPFVFQVDVILVKEELVVLINLSQLMAEKIEETISYVRGYFNRQIEIEVVRFYSCMIRGACLPSTSWYQELE